MSGMKLFVSRLVPGNQAIQIVAVGSVGAERLLIKQTLDAASQANLIGMILKAYRPTHPAVPAAAKYHYARRPQTGRNYTQRPQPTRLLVLIPHPHTTCKSFH